MEQRWTRPTEQLVSSAPGANLERVEDAPASQRASAGSLQATKPAGARPDHSQAAAGLPAGACCSSGRLPLMRPTQGTNQARVLFKWKGGAAAELLPFLAVAR